MTRLAFLGLSLFLIGANPGAQGALIREVELVSPSSGWAIVGQHLLWRSGGNGWEEITPPGNYDLDAVGFLDSMKGWAVLDKRDSTPDQVPSLSLGLTSDGGKTWTSVPLTGEDIKQVENSYSGTAYLTFVDADHGWLMLRATSSSNFSFGDLFSTSDGGKSWTHLPAPPIGGAIRFISRSTGWLAGGPDGGELFRTEDGGKTWTQQRLSQWGGVESAGDKQLALPYFPDVKSGQGLLVASLQRPGRSSLAIFETTDIGRTWRLESIEGGLPEGQKSAVAAADSKILHMTISDGTVRVGSLGAMRISQVPSTPTRNTTIRQLVFADTQHGWVVLEQTQCASRGANCTTDTHLWATSDGGSNFVDQTPPFTSPERLDTVPATRVPPAWTQPRARPGSTNGEGEKPQ